MVWPTHIYVLSPGLSEGFESSDKNLLLSNEYGKQDSVLQLVQVLQECDHSTHIELISITLAKKDLILQKLGGHCSSGQKMCVVNLCDGTELDGYPGISVVRFLEEHSIPFTGADKYFYDATTSKPVLKKKLQSQNVETSAFVEIRPGHEEEDVRLCERVIGWPMIVKPSVSYASISISDKSVVHSLVEALAQIEVVSQTTSSGVFIESFLAGREFTALVTGSAERNLKVYPVAERVFNSILKQEQRLLAFDRYWEGYDLQGSKPSAETQQLYWYEKAREDWQDFLQDLAKRAYVACGGNGYGRVDIRTKSLNKVDAFVLEVNANCGLSFGEGSSSLGEILHLSGVSPSSFCKELILLAINRNESV